MFKPSVAAEGERRLGTIQRSVILENRLALRRRWHIARAGDQDPRQLNHWFPDQRYLFDVLRTVDEATVDKLADCTFPLFGLKSMSFFKVENAPVGPEANPGDHGRESEVYSALVARLDALRTAESEAKLCFGLRSDDVLWLGPFCPIELRRIAFDPALKLNLAVSEKYFVAAATSVLSRREKGILAVTTRLH